MDIKESHVFHGYEAAFSKTGSVRKTLSRLLRLGGEKTSDCRFVLLYVCTLSKKENAIQIINSERSGPLKAKNTL